MSRYVFEEPEQMLDWIDTVAFKLLKITREEFGKIEINIKRTTDAGNYPFILHETDRNAWKRRFEDENIRKESERLSKKAMPCRDSH